jgi:hypothetical protein
MGVLVLYHQFVADTLIVRKKDETPQKATISYDSSTLYEPFNPENVYYHPCPLLPAAIDQVDVKKNTSYSF